MLLIDYNGKIVEEEEKNISTKKMITIAIWLPYIEPVYNEDVLLRLIRKDDIIKSILNRRNKDGNTKS